MNAGRQRWEPAPAVAVALLAIGVVVAALWLGAPNDARLAYLGGAEAWRSGHPENLYTWNSTPFLALLMALVTRVASVGAYATALNILNLLLAAASIASVWARLRGVLERRLWWLSLAGVVAFAPLSSTLWWKQLNLVALALAVLGWHLLRTSEHRRYLAGPALIALSLSIKPLLLLLPVALLARREDRRAGLLVIGWTAVLQMAAQVFLAWRAGNLATLSPLPALLNFNAKAQPSVGDSACNVQNFSPAATLCRLLRGPELWSLQRFAVLAFAVALTILAWRVLAGRRAGSWEVFAVAATLSPLFSPISWTHYQLLLAPLFVVLLVQLPLRRDALPLWILLGLAFLMAEASWTPIGSIADLGSVLRVLPATDRRTYGMLLTFGSFAQYFLLAAALLAWRRPVRIRDSRPLSVLAENSGR